MRNFEEITSVTSRYRAAQLAANVEVNNRLRAMLAGEKPKPLTRWERVRYAFNEYRCRFRDAWWVLTGKADISHAEDE